MSAARSSLEKEDTHREAEESGGQICNSVTRK